MEHEGRRWDLLAVGGWIFADLLLALFALFFIANTRGEVAPPTVSPTLTNAPTAAATAAASSTSTATPTASSTSTPTGTVVASRTPTPCPTCPPTPTPAACPATPEPIVCPPVAISPNCKIAKVMEVRPDTWQVDAERELIELQDIGCRAGLVVAKGDGESTDEGQNRARRMAEYLKHYIPEMFANALFRPLHSAYPGASVKLEIYFYTVSGHDLCQTSQECKE